MKAIYKTAIAAVAAMLMLAACGNAGAKTAERKEIKGCHIPGRLGKRMVMEISRNVDPCTA